MRRVNTLLFFAALSVAALGQTAHAAVRTWDGDTSTDWADSANWNTIPADNITSDVATFSGTVTANLPVVSTARSVLGVNFTTTTSGWTLSGAGPLTLGTTGIDTTGTGTGTDAVSLTDIALGANSTWTTATGRTLSVSSNVSGAFTLTKTGGGFLNLTGLSTYTGKTSTTGELHFNSIGNADGTPSALGAPTTVANGTIGVGSAAASGSLIYEGSANAITDRVVDMPGTTAAARLYSSGTGTITYTSDFTVTGVGLHAIALRGTNTGDNTISGKIVDNSAVNITRIQKDDTGKWVLTGASTYSGSTTHFVGTLQFNSIANADGTPSALGAPATVADGTILLGSFGNDAILRYTGSGHSTDRVVDLSSAGGGAGIGYEISADGGGALTFTSAFTATGTGAKTLTLRGTNTGANTVGGAIVDGAGVTSLTKNDAGKWILGGANTYTGATTVSNGTLTVSGASATLGTGNVTVQGSNAGTNLAIAGGVTNAIADTATLNLLGGGTVGTADQGYANLGAGISEKVGVLQLNSVAQATGLTYGSTGSPAVIKSNEYFAGAGVVSVGLPGDFNGNNSVDAADYALWSKNSAGLGGTAGYSLWRTNFGNTFPASGSDSRLGNASVPEPGAILLSITAILGLAVTHRKARQRG